MARKKTMVVESDLPTPLSINVDENTVDLPSGRSVQPDTKPLRARIAKIGDAVRVVE